MTKLTELRQSFLELQLEDYTDLLEKLKPSDPTGKYIHDFVHSDNPKFAGKSKKERIRMALGAKYGAMRKMKEEVEQTDEAVTNYNPKSQGGTRKELLAKYAETGNSKHAEAARKAGASHEELKKAQMTAMKRGVGKKGSNYLLSKNEEVEQTDEAMSHQAKTTLKHIKPGTLRQNYGDKKDAANIKPGISGVSDRLAMLARAKKEGRLKD